MIKIKKTLVEVRSIKSLRSRLGLCIDFKKDKRLFAGCSLIAKEEKLRRLCRAALATAHRQKNRILYLRLYAVEGFPHRGLTRVVTQEIHHFLTRHSTHIQKIIIAPQEKKLHGVFQKEVQGYFNHLLKTLAGEPYTTVDVIIEMPKGIVIIERSNPPFGWALPGGFVDRDESLEKAVQREAMEETSLRLKELRQFHTYSDPRRDPRFHTIDTVFIAKGVGTPKSGDDAKNLKIVPYRELLKGAYAFDHKQILKEYLKTRSKNKA